MTTQRVNPMAGPAYVIALRNALEHRKLEYDTPPRTGGTQISTRFDDFVFNHVEAIVAECGWNRAEVLYALVQRGLFDLYEFLSPQVVENIVHRIVSKTAPPQPPVPIAPLVPNEETIKAMRAARRGELHTASSPEALIANLNADN